MNFHPGMPPVETELALRAKKTAVRTEIRERLRQLNDRAHRSAQLCVGLGERPAWQNAAIIGMFAPLLDEPDIELLRPGAREKTLCYPVIDNHSLHFVAVADPGTLVRGIHGIRQPLFNPAQVIALDQLELIVVPGTAFTRAGQRLGRGGGFYDRLLANRERRAATIGVCFDCQLLPELPVEPHDQAVDEVVTESSVQSR